MTPNEVEEMIRLIHSGIDLELLSFELDIPIEKIEEYKEQLALRKFVKESIRIGKTQEAKEQLEHFIKGSENTMVEKMMLAKLQAYINKTEIEEETIKEIEEEKKKIGFSGNIDEILNELGVQIPKRKNSNLKRKEKPKEEIAKKPIEEKEIGDILQKPDYEKMIKKYKIAIEMKAQNSINERNLLAFTYFSAGQIEEAREELLSLIEQYSNYTAYRQLVYLEKSEGNLDDARLWAYECLEKYPDSIAMREMLIKIARLQKDNQEVIKQLKEILSIQPDKKRKEKVIHQIRNEER